MSGLGYSDDLRDYYFSADPEIAELDTLELRHPGFIDQNGNVVAIRIVNRQEDFSATLEAGAQMDGGEMVTFQACGFTVKRPESSDQGSPTLEFSVSNISRLLVPYLDIAASGTDPLYMTYRLFLSDDTTQPHFIVDWLNVVLVTVGIIDVKATAGFEDILNKPFGRSVYTARDYPGLDR